MEMKYLFHQWIPEIKYNFISPCSKKGYCRKDIFVQDEDVGAIDMGLLKLSLVPEKELIGDICIREVLSLIPESIRKTFMGHEHMVHVLNFSNKISKKWNKEGEILFANTFWQMVGFNINYVSSAKVFFDNEEKKSKFYEIDKEIKKDFDFKNYFIAVFYEKCSMAIIEEEISPFLSIEDPI